MNRLITYISIFAAIFSISPKTYSQEVYSQEVTNEAQYRTSVNLGFKVHKKIRLKIAPELRFDETFSLDKYILKASAEYKVIKPLSVGATYRFIGNLREIKATEYLHQYAIDATVKKKFQNLKPAIRLRYSNYADDEIEGKEYLRYRGMLKYNIKNCKMTPFVAAEAFQQLEDNVLYKMRYSAGLNYKLFKNNSLGFNYRFDYYRKEYKNRHIFSLKYNVQF